MKVRFDLPCSLAQFAAAVRAIGWVFPQSTMDAAGGGVVVIPEGARPPDPDDQPNLVDAVIEFLHDALADLQGDDPLYQAFMGLDGRESARLVKDAAEAAVTVLMAGLS